MLKTHSHGKPFMCFSSLLSLRSFQFSDRKLWTEQQWICLTLVVFVEPGLAPLDAVFHQNKKVTNICSSIRHTTPLIKSKNCSNFPFRYAIKMRVKCPFLPLDEILFFFFNDSYTILFNKTSHTYNIQSIKNIDIQKIRSLTNSA